MRLQKNFKSLLALSVFAGVCFLQADVVTVKDGSRLVGTVTGIDAGSVTLKTAYAGAITIQQSEVTSIETESPLVVRLSGGTTMAGTLSTPSAGQVSIKGEDGTITTSVDKVATTWAPGAKDPAVAALEPKWSYQASVDLTGKTGNSEELGTSAGFVATRRSSDEILKFYTNYNRQKTNGTKSADKFQLGVDYSHYMTERLSWYLRDEGGFDRVKDIDFYNIAAAGFGYDFIKKSQQTLTGRTGLSYRFEDYGNPATSDVSSVGLDFALIHDYRFANSHLHNEITFVPSFDDFGNYQASHNSYYEIPLGAGFWKLRFGIANDYLSRPGPGVDKLDTTYYTRMVLNWGN